MQNEINALLRLYGFYMNMLHIQKKISVLLCLMFVAFAYSASLTESDTDFSSNELFPLFNTEEHQFFSVDQFDRPDALFFIPEAGSEAASSEGFNPETGIKISCPLCPESFAKKSNLTRHIKSIHERVMHQCPFCSKSIADKSNLNKHIRNRHGGFMHQCPLCKKKCTDKSNLKRHIQCIHEGIKRRHQKYSCSICEKVFANKHVVDKHLESVHDIHEKPRYPCSACEIIFTFKSSLNKHIQNQHPETAMRSKRQRKQALLVEEADVPAPVAAEPEALLSSSSYKKYICESCGKAFSGKSGLRQHIETKHDEKNIKQCSFCGKCYIGESALKRHNDTEHGDTQEHLEASGSGKRQRKH